jgi:O-antigen ligase
MINNKIDNILSTSLILILPLLVTGPFLADLVLTTCSIFFIILLIVKSNLIYLKKPFFLFFFIFIISIIISSFLSNNFKSIVSSFGYLRFLFFIFLTIFIIKNSKKDLFLLIFYSLFFTNFYLILEFFSQSYLGYTLFGNQVLNSGRLIISSFYHEEIYSSYIVRIFPFFLGLFFLNQDKLKFFTKISFYGLVILLILSVIFNGERTAIGLLVLSFLFLFIFLQNSKKTKFKMLFTTFIIVLVILINVPTNNLERKINGIVDFKNTISQVFSKEKDKKIIFSEKYDSMYKTGLNIYKQNLIIGIGIKNFRVECSDQKYAFNNKSCATHPHNLVIQLLAETGTIGFLFYICIIFLIIKILFKNIKKKTTSKNQKNYITCLICCFLISLWPFFPSGNFFNNWLSIITFYPAGFLINEIPYLKKNQK